MTLSQKLAVALIVGMTAIMSLNAVVRLRLEIARFDTDQAGDHATQGHRLADTLEWIWLADGVEQARKALERADAAVSERGLAWVWLDDLRRTRRVPPSAVRTLAEGETFSMIHTDEAGIELRSTFVPLIVGDPLAAALEMREPRSPSRAYVRARIAQHALTTAIVLALCAALALALGSWLVGRPLRRLSEKARRVGEGDFSGRLDFRQRDDIGRLATEIDAMCDRLDEATRRAAAENEGRIAALEQLRHLDRLKTVGQLASGVAHELGTPLNVVLGRAKMIAAGDVEGADAARNGRIIVEQTNRMTAIIRQLLDFSRRQQPRTHTGALDRIAERAVEMLAPLAAQRRVAVRFESDGGPMQADVDEGQVLQALTNLLLNGIQAMEHGGALTVRVARARARPPADHGGPEDTYAAVSVHDQGAGISARDLPYVFEPFFTTKGVGEGTGLGLSVSYGIVRDHGGWIAVESTPGRGSCFTVFLPPSAPPGARASGGGGAT